MIYSQEYIDNQLGFYPNGRTAYYEPEDFTQEEQQFLSELDSIIDGKDVSQIQILKSLTQLMFCMIRQISKILPFLSSFGNTIDDNINQKLDSLQNDIKSLRESQNIQLSIPINSIQRQLTELRTNVQEPPTLMKIFTLHAKEGS